MKKRKKCLLNQKKRKNNEKEKTFVKVERILETVMAFAQYSMKSFINAMPVWLKTKLFIPSQIDKHFEKNYSVQYILQLTTSHIVPVRFFLLHLKKLQFSVQMELESGILRLRALENFVLLKEEQNKIDGIEQYQQQFTLD